MNWATVSERPQQQESEVLENQLVGSRTGRTLLCTITSPVTENIVKITSVMAQFVLK
jgi:hypothetical protein